VRHYSILEYARFRWFKVAIALSILAAAAYLWHDPVPKPYGGTWLGYTLGTIGAVLILWLLWYGVRKRSYASNVGTVQGWLSAHVYLGSALVIVVTLHTGFELGWNVHTLAYVLMLAVVFSGIYGVVVYLRVPGAMTENMGEDTLAGIIVGLADLDREMRERALSLPDQLLALVDRSVAGTRLGPGRRPVPREPDGLRPPAEGQPGQRLEPQPARYRRAAARAQQPGSSRGSGALAVRFLVSGCVRRSRPGRYPPRPSCSRPGRPPGLRRRRRRLIRGQAYLAQVLGHRPEQEEHGQAHTGHDQEANGPRCRRACRGLARG